MFNNLFLFTALIGFMALAPQTAIANTPYERVSTKTYEVNVRGNSYDDRDEVLKDALRKAAKKTIKNDYDWFRVINREIESEEKAISNSYHGSVERVPERRCGLLGCTTTYSTQTRNDFRASFNDRESVRHSIRLEYVMGIGPVKDSKNVYDARDVKASK